MRRWSCIDRSVDATTAINAAIDLRRWVDATAAIDAAIDLGQLMPMGCIDEVTSVDR